MSTQPSTQPTALPSVDDILDGTPSAKFETIGDTVTGRIITSESRQQTDMDTGELLFWNDGRPRMQVLITLEQPDGDDVRLYVKGNMQNAIKKALRDSDAKLLPGGTLTVTYTGDGEPTKRGWNAPKQYTAVYQPGDAFDQAAAAEAPAAPTQATAAPEPAPEPPPAPASAAGPQRPASVPDAVWITLTPEQQQAMSSIQ